MCTTRLLHAAIVAIALTWTLAPPTMAGEVDVLGLPFGAKRSTIGNLSASKITGQRGFSYYARREKDMRFAGVELWEVYYGFEAERLVEVVMQTFAFDPVARTCFKTRATKAIDERMRALFGRRIRHVGFASSPDEYEMNYEDYEKCMDAFPRAYSCEVDVFENWKIDAKNTDRALEATMHLVSFGRPIKKCVAQFLFRRGRALADKRADEKFYEDMREEVLKGFGTE